MEENKQSRTALGIGMIWTFLFIVGFAGGIVVGLNFMR